ncbi:hypothetical protein [Streptomyces aurantiogriseus]|uniref:Uncharacterized protein n=1 Tax=Streptomyces aurantiogriseus TaxID=66870 RepID=A0A918FDQ9_9ACTN|nr:hypothetical protein [Streptomyces aurantiogriseus]GGR25847.1 hypothetical protein GCM10010251_47440 [Streptomyces aurantiogriseus]
MTDGIAWISDRLGDGLGFSLTLVKGIGHEELAVRLGARPGTLMDPDTAREMLELSPGPWDLPDYAVVGDTGNGWAFALESPAATDRADRLGPGRDLWSTHTVVTIWDSTMDPPIISAAVDGRFDWMFWEYNTGHTDHPLTRRLITEAGFVAGPNGVHRDDRFGARVTMTNVYRIVGDHYGLTLPRQAIADRRLPHVFTEPTVRVRSRARCPFCGGQMVPYGGGSWAPGEYRLVCVFYKVRDQPGRPPQGCPGEISGPAVAEAVDVEPNPKYDNVRMPSGG